MKDKTKDNVVDGQDHNADWSMPMSKINARVLLGNLGTRKFGTLVGDNKKKINRQLYQFDLSQLAIPEWAKKIMREKHTTRKV